MGDFLDAASELPDRPLQFLLGFGVKVALVGTAYGMALASLRIDDVSQFRPTDLKGNLQFAAGDDIPLSGVKLF